MRSNRPDRQPPSAAFHWARKCGLLLLVGVCFVLPARADLVSGRVSGAENKFEARDTFVVKDSTGKVVKEVKTDEYKGFSVFLQPGSYQVEFVDKDKKVWQATLESYPQPARQDIELKRKNKK
jgi:hypothetical protein